jgi:hypothetical protein
MTRELSQNEFLSDIRRVDADDDEAFLKFANFSFFIFFKNRSGADQIAKTVESQLKWNFQLIDHYRLPQIMFSFVGASFGGMLRPGLQFGFKFTFSSVKC